MKILVIDEEFPYPLNTGKRIRSYNLVRALARDNEVTYLAYGEAGSDGYQSLERAGLKPVAAGQLRRKKSGLMFYWRLLLNLLSPDPYIVTHHYTARFRNKLNELLAGDPYDVIICEWTPYARYVRDIHGVPSVIVAHNIEASIWKRYYENDRNPLRRIYIGIQARKVENFERRCFGWAAGATAVSREEAEEIAGYGVHYPVEVIDNGVDIEFFSPDDTIPDPDTIVFTGSMDWRPNQDAVTYFVESIFPLIRQRRPSAKVFLVGRKPPLKVEQLGQVDGVTVTGTVDDVRPFIDRAGVYVVPLRIGGGSRLKILEAMAMGKVVVSTSIGAEGLEVADGENILIRDEEQAIANQVVDCLEHPEKYHQLAEQGRKLVTSRYRWEDLGQRFHEYLAKILARS
ncbi:glycosyltransferase [candidate division GN15 bacterium]|nr:glycosyltransferase [candidate division GN15 bacterium]